MTLTEDIKELITDVAKTKEHLKAQEDKLTVWLAEKHANKEVTLDAVSGYYTLISAKAGFDYETYITSLESGKYDNRGGVGVQSQIC